jgi:hypothetical protein
MLFMEDVGDQFSDSEILGLRDYLLKGGFLWVDDFWGSVAGSVGGGTAARVAEQRISDLRSPISHPVMHTIYDVTDYLQVSSINFGIEAPGRCRARL